MLNTIVVALESSDLGDHVIETVQQLQLSPGVKIILAHVISTSDSDLEIAADRPQSEAEATPYRHIEKQLQAYQAMLPFQSELEIVTGDPAEEIIRLANIYHADLIAIGTRGLTGVKRILQGSVSSQVVENASCSVLVVKPIG
ncbi:universal stress protein [Chlorogloea sp. CCALA 695]|uniref:universal stress protein n=1 Tax=Chlorogloea sp. CCALA 695 TaxID=2107693 RepID=UPI000D062502|nr:universal stress protein [Chlorogloea sp. CCALA 695]PSB31566.1 universal stress protein [Chlorogloea sp. CCALA 695]